jgi:energy-coupling factor transport system ATP-binding protein
VTILRAEQLGFAYPQDHRGVVPVSFALDRGECLLIHGRSGCGKSTLARCLAGLIPHLYNGEMVGKVWIKGRCSAEMALWEITEQVGLVFQNPAFQMLAPTVEEEIIFGLENLGLAADEIRKRLEQVIGQFDLGAFRKRSPHSLSGGEQQKLALAATLARRPDILVLDEPLSMLDCTAAAEFVDSLRGLLTNGTSMVICEHRQQYLQAIPGLARLDLGSPAAESSADEAPVPAYPKTCRPFELQIEGLNVQLGKQRILDELSLNLRSGQVVALVGRNGAGKTTLLRALAGLQPHQGTIWARDEAGKTPAQFNMVFQNPDTQLFNPTVREEILYKNPGYDVELYAWLMQALDLKRYESTPPLLLSEGEKRRVALAIALIHPCRHGVVLDEPSLGQDLAHKHFLMRLLKAMAGAGWLVLFSTHDLELAAQADQMILLTAQGLVCAGATGAVLQDRAAWERVGLHRPDWMRLG